MEADQDKLQARTVADACFLALGIYFRFIKQLLVIRKQMCYLCSEFKPQHAFKRVLADNSYSQFKHLKRQETDSHSGEENSNLHPYKGEISNLMKNPNLEFLNFLDGRGKRSMEMGDSYVWVETEAQLRELVEVLKNEKVFAVDVEHHSLRSFRGFTSLVQISTISEDYLVDAIKLHDVMRLLRPVFANPGICKVFHGANNDVLWHQRDFLIYVVNLFDTEKACQILPKPETSLKYLLQTYCSFTKNKEAQTKDWSQRPLPEEMIKYARGDTYYLLYITHILCSELKDKLKIENSSNGDEFPFLLEASERSNETCLRLFEKHIEGIISSSVGDAKEIVKRLCLWRNVMARIHDESLGFILSDNAINALAAGIPKTEADICSTICKADSDAEYPSAVVRSHLKDLLWLLQDKMPNNNLDNGILQMVIQRHLGPAGSCPRSAYNYALLSIGRSDIIMSSHNGSSASKQLAKKTSQVPLAKTNSRKAPLYKEFKVYTQSGQFLGYCDSDKAYNMEALDYAYVYDEDEDEDGNIPPSVWLNYEIRVPIPVDYEIRTMKNKCVGCSKVRKLTKYHIVPPPYAINFLPHLEGGLSHDTIALCPKCKEKLMLLLRGTKNS